MTSFEQVSAALKEFGADQNRVTGQHESHIIEVGNRGRATSDLQFDPSKHDPAHINPLSPMGIVLDMPHVTKRKPEYPLNINVIIHQEKTDDHSGILIAKRQLGRALMWGLDHARPQHADRVHGFVIGTAGNPDNLDAEYITAPNEETATREIAAITESGLTFIVSDFANFALSGLTKANFPATVAVKANHPFELELPANSGKWATTDKPINTGKPKELAAYNAALAAQHQAKITNLQDLGMTVAPVVFDFQAELGFQEPAVDAAIAHAIRAVNRP